MPSPDSSAPPRNSKLAAASLICFLVSIPTAHIGWAARGTDTPWLWPLGAAVTALLWTASAVLALAAMVVILTKPGRVKGIGFAIAALVLVAAAAAWAVIEILSVPRVR